MIAVFGSINVDLVARVEAIPRPGETVIAPGHEKLSGGKGANQAVAAARAGAKVSFVGAVGQDAFGTGEAENLAAESVDTDFLARLDEPTGCAFITVDRDGENAITVTSGANRLVRADFLTPALAQSPAYLLLQMELAAGEVMKAAELGRSAGARVILNLAPVPPGIDMPRLHALMGRADILIVNQHELEAIVRVLGPDMVEAGNTPQERTGALAAWASITVITTLGAEGALLAEGATPVRRFIAPTIQPVDTTGAGDTFCGVLAASLDTGLPMDRAVERAIAAASLACLSPGARSAMPPGAAITEMLPA